MIRKISGVMWLWFLICPSVFAAPIAVNQILPMTAVAKDSMNRNSKTYTGRSCLPSGTYAVMDAYSNASTTDFAEFFRLQNIYHKGKFKDIKGIEITSKIYADKSAFLLVDDAARKYKSQFYEYVLMPYNGSQHIIMYGCQLAPK